MPVPRLVGSFRQSALLLLSRDNRCLLRRASLVCNRRLAHVPAAHTSISQPQRWAVATGSHASSSSNSSSSSTIQGSGVPARSRLVLADAMAFVYRVHHGFGPGRRLRNAAGEDTTVLYGFLNMLLSLLAGVESGSSDSSGSAEGSRTRPTHLAVVFDAPGKTFRHQLYSGYKGQRPDVPEEISGALVRLHELLDALAVPVFAVSGVEADDVIGTIALRAVGAGMAVDVASPDKDFFQLLRPGLRLLRPSSLPKLAPGRSSAAAAAADGGTGSGSSNRISSGTGSGSSWSMTPFSSEDFEAAYPGLTPAQWVDVLALSGDASDNVPGVKGIGMKTALQLLAAHGSIEELLRADPGGGTLPKRAAAALSAPGTAAVAELSKRLVTIQTNLDLPPLNISLDELRLRRPADGGALARALLEDDLQFRRHSAAWSELWQQQQYQA